VVLTSVSAAKAAWRDGRASGRRDKRLCLLQTGVIKELPTVLQERMTRRSFPHGRNPNDQGVLEAPNTIAQPEDCISVPNLRPVPTKNQATSHAGFSTTMPDTTATRSPRLNAG